MCEILEVKPLLNYIESAELEGLIKEIRELYPFVPGLNNKTIETTIKEIQNYIVYFRDPANYREALRERIYKNEKGRIRKIQSTHENLKNTLITMINNLKSEINHLKSAVEYAQKCKGEPFLLKEIEEANKQILILMNDNDKLAEDNERILKQIQDNKEGIAIQRNYIKRKEGEIKNL